MTGAISGLFGGQPKKPVIKKQKPLKQVEQQQVAKDQVMRDLAKRRKATVLMQQSSQQLKTKRETLGTA